MGAPLSIVIVIAMMRHDEESFSPMKEEEKQPLEYCTTREQNFARKNRAECGKSKVRMEGGSLRVEHSGVTRAIH